MNFKKLEREFRHLSTSHKVIFLGSVSAMILAFVPWFEINRGIGITEDIDRINGFSKYGIFGFISFTFAAICFFVLLREMLYRKISTFSFHNSLVFMALSGEAIFALTISIFVFSTLFNDFSEANFRFGIFMSILAHIFIFGGANFSFLESKKASAKKSFKTLSDEDLMRLNLQPEELDVPEEQLSLGD